MPMLKERELDSNLAVDYAAFTDHSSFEKTYKNSYSHGFEKIYALENVDIRSVRKIDLSNQRPLENSEDGVDQLAKDKEVLKQQLEFDFDSITLEPFVLREPIQVLGLSQRVESLLLTQQKLLIKDLLTKDSRSLSGIAGLGFGHLDELQNRLQMHLKGKNLSKVSSIDFYSWARTLIGDISAKKAFVALESYELCELLTLSTAENIEVKKSVPQAKQRWVEEVIADLNSSSKVDQFCADFISVTQRFIIPWLDRRQGIASTVELQERLLALSTSNHEGFRVLKWMEKVYGNDESLFNHSLISADEGIYCTSTDKKEEFEAVVDMAKSYFYRGNLSYTLPSLIDWITAEFAKKWICFVDGFIEKVIKICPQFSVRKGKCGNLIVKLS